MPATPKPKTPRKKRTADGEESPTKKAKATPKRKTKKPIDTQNTDDEFANVKVKPEEADGLNDNFQDMIAREVEAEQRGA